MSATSTTTPSRPHAPVFHRAPCREWVEALVFRYGQVAVRRAFAGLPPERPTDKPLAEKMEALVAHFGATRVRSCLEPSTPAGATFTCACPGDGPGGRRLNVGPADLADRSCLTCGSAYKPVVA